MSLFIDRQYIGSITHKLPLFKKKSENLFTFRCVYCKDSKRSKIKTRGYLYVKGNDFYFRCHNCGESHTFSNFLKFLDPNIHKKYVMERFSKGENGHSNYKKPTDFKMDTKSRFVQKTINLPSIAELPENHFCREYVEKIRLVPKEHLERLYFAKDFAAFTEQLVPGKYKNLEHTPKLIIPFFNADKKFFAFQGRSLVDSNRYVTIKLDDNEPKIYGQERVDFNEKIYVVEGPLDSLFLPNAIAVCDSNLGSVYKLTNNNFVFIFDNENHSAEIKSKMSQIIDKGYNIFIWPNYMKHYGKDINAVIQNGVYGPEQIKMIIDRYTFHGLEAEMAFAKWSRI
jgi:hypothetical protein